ncbi:MAG: PAS domain-containing protein, partial [Gammaproteobacteria bacterium]|nr:PAS domain-containing protein [Gammaproteobacteria bacterium]
MTADLVEQPAQSQSKTARALSLLSGLLVCLLGISVFIGWLLSSADMTRIRPRWPAMAPITTLAFALGGAALFGLAVLDRRSKLRLAGVGTAGIVLALGGLLKLIDAGSGLHVLADDLWFTDAAGRVALFTALSFVLLGSCIALEASGTRLFLGLFQGFALTTVLLGWLGLSRYLYGALALPPDVPYADMALHTAVGIMLFAFGVLCTRTDGGLTGLIVADSTGGMLARRLLPPAVLVPFAIGWLGLKAQERGWLDTAESISAFALWNVIIFGAAVWITAHLVHRTDIRRRYAERSTRKHLEHLATVIQNEPECVKLVDADGRLLEMNPAGLAMLEVSSLTEAQRSRLADYLLPQYRAAFGALHHEVMTGGSGTVEFE